MKEVTFVIHPAEEGGFWAEAQELSISTQGETLDELARMIQDAVAGYYFDQPQEIPQTINWRFSTRLKVA